MNKSSIFYANMLYNHCIIIRIVYYFAVSASFNHKKRSRLILNHDRHGAVLIILSNTGKQLTTEQISKVFDRFYRADPSRSRVTGGYGLGLCVALSIARLHNGNITAESKNGANTFTVTLGEIPIENADADVKDKRSK
jgi:signal transduction histidine kinase